MPLSEVVLTLPFFVIGLGTLCVVLAAVALDLDPPQGPLV
jgi:hypothetical protein